MNFGFRLEYVERKNIAIERLVRQENYAADTYLKRRPRKDLGACGKNM